MATGQLTKVVERLRTVLASQDVAGIADGDLLKRYVLQRDEAAFETLVRRHGPMVMGVCRRVLHNSHDADDAFQATFLVLVRKAATLQSPGMIGNRLYGVAYRTALEARKLAAKRRAKEAKVVPQTETPPVDSWTDLRPVLDQELERLPEKYRAVVVLCDLEGKTRKEAARHLGLPEGTVASRLAQARTMLAKRLSRLGLAVSGGVLATALSQNATACVSPSVVGSTIKAASLLAAGQAAGVISAKVALLTEGVMKTMLLTKLKIVTVLVVVAAISGTAGVIWHTQAAEPQQTQEKQKADKGTSEEKDKQKAVVELQMAEANLRQEEARKAQAEADLVQAKARLQVAENSVKRAQANYDRLKNFMKLSQKGEDAKKQDEVDNVQGAWRLITTEFDGVKIGEGRPEIKDSKLVIEKSSFTLNSKLFHSPNVPLDTEDVKVNGMLTLDAKKNPKEITLTWDKDPWNNKKNYTRRGIYALDGDSLKICLSMDEEAKSSPTEFSANFGSKRSLLIFRRESAPKKGEEKKP